MESRLMRHRTWKRLPVVCTAVSVWLLAAGGAVTLAQYTSAAEHSAIAYSKSAPTDAVAKLQAAIESGQTGLVFDGELGSLPAVLRALDVPVSSQSLVFSRTSLQVDHIG